MNQDKEEEDEYQSWNKVREEGMNQNKEEEIKYLTSNKDERERDRTDRSIKGRNRKEGNYLAEGYNHKKVGIQCAVNCVSENDIKLLVSLDSVLVCFLSYLSFSLPAKFFSFYFQHIGR